MKLLADSLYAEEAKLEEDAVKRGIDRYRDLAKQAESKGDGASLKASERLLLYWFEAFRRTITRERRSCDERKAGVGRRIYGKYMRLLDTRETALIAMHTILGKCLAEPGGIHDVKVVLAIGRNLCANMARKKFHRADRDSWYALMHTDRKQIKPKGVLKVARKFFPEEVWPIKVQGAIGATLLKLLTGVATVPDSKGRHHPAFEMKKVWRRRRTYYYLSLTPEADKVIRDAHTFRESLHPIYQPMIVRPIAWTRRHLGGYLRHARSLIKQPHRHKKHNEHKNDVVLSAMNVLGSTPWRINKRILEVAKELRDQGGNVPGIPRMSELPMPPLPADFNDNEDAKKAWKRDAWRTHNRNIGLKGERMVTWHKLDIAERFKDYENIYFPHDLDFRTRAYAIPLFLNHQGDDLCRGLLEFSKGRETNLDSEHWLLRHLANCCGIDKVSFSDRREWVLDNTGRFQGWHNDPLENTDWLDVDKPFQALSAAFAIFGDEAAGHIPIQVDGSNNALQHYGAMLRCPETAGLVNLMPSDAPADVYIDVVETTRRMIAADAENGNAYAIKLENWVTRKVIKQTVMTSWYGITAIGARTQLHEWLVKAGFDNQEFYENELYQVTRYLTGVVNKATSSVCVAARDAMTWLSRCARIIAKSGQTVRWNTPVGVRVEQPYKRANQFRIETILHNLTLDDDSGNCPPHVTRQGTRIAPNFVHGLDASHMMLTANRTRSERPNDPIAFAQVFDSYWTHAADMDVVARLLRETFVKLHEHPLLDDLHWQMQAEYPGLEFPKPPEVGLFDLKQVLDSPYFFS